MAIAPQSEGSAPAQRPLNGTVGVKPAERRSSDTALVLTGGGARAAYQVGVLSAIAERAPDLEIPILTGTSAGAINAAYLASHEGSLREAVRGLQDQWRRLTADIIYGPRASTLMRLIARWLESTRFHRRDGRPAVRGFFDTLSFRRFLEQAIDFGGIEVNIARGRLRAVALTAMSYATGQTVTFVQGQAGVPLWERAHRGARRAQLAIDHLMASSAIPIVFPAVWLGDSYYGDGSVRQTFPLSPAIHLGARRILAIGTRPTFGRPVTSVPLESAYPSVAHSLGLLLDSVFMDHLDADAEVLGGVNSLQAERTAGGRLPDSFNPVDLLLFRPSRDLGQIARDCAYRLPRIIRSLARGLGAESQEGTDFLSYLLFEPAYTSQLVDLGYADALADWERVEKLLAPAKRDPNG